ncbi:MAG TPA: SusF/SusE family outer membrane protein [Bacilli bacterium]|nr:SusF/SusE family outer membrane protein [Bacilli bacterium]
MNKLFKGILATVLSVGFLAGCGQTETHTVTFFEDTVGKFYAEVEVEHNKAVKMPVDPSRTGYDFDGWFTTTALTTEFAPETLIVEDIDLFGKWTKQYVPDERTFHIIGDLANTAYESSWSTAADAYQNTHLTVSPTSNLFSIEIEIGWMGKFKVKEPGAGWDEGQEYDFTDIPEALVPEYVQEGDTRNVQVKSAGLYRVQVETDLGELYIERIGDAVGEGVKPDPEEGAILNWGIVGSMSYSNWAGTDIKLHYNEEGQYHFYNGILLTAEDGFKFRVGDDWAIQVGSGATAVLPADGSILNTMELVGDVEQIKEGENFIVVETGYYSVFIKTVEEKHVVTIEKMEFVTRGTATAGGWDADSGALAFVSSTAVVDTTTSFTLVYSSVFSLLPGELKVKLGGYAEVVGWDVAFGDDLGANFTVTTPGNYTVTLTVVHDFATDTFSAGVATVVAVAE